MFFLLVLILPIILFFSKWCTHYIQPGMTKLLSFIGVLFTCYMILIGDEVLGGIQFGYLCYLSPRLEVLTDELEGRKIRSTSSITEVKLSPVKIKEELVVMKDVDTGQPIFKYSYYRFYGGWLAHWINFNGFKGPYFYSNTCNQGSGSKLLIINNNIVVEE
ncbi:hypothetical protein G3485_13805 [Shewanella baltica]|uniref:Uncharacterized protein n=2 Tax=Shewanella TaxID=22 RepID=A0ABU9UYF1_9GAMM|nr:MULTISPECIES: hypothetical protein [Shewanella]MCS6128058.1 hypothetical protein [Shewanella baltica]MCS6140075.1 hypothetical protein [Shewanella baltica]MCS6146216.1 hypothetical protein [Shewanella baltica]MCS6170802.1 hypothetical protein [Shewanella baltica]MCS6175938.1 hypothetical protein [Shewanella baltica]